MYGAAKLKLDQAGMNLDSQKCVCFTETPLEYVHLLLEEIENRDFLFKPYGVALTKKMGRNLGVNPVWYVDISPGHEWLMNPINRLMDHALQNPPFDDHDVARLVPFIEQMGTMRDAQGVLKYRKEFWWEREWRNQGDLKLPERIVVFCPEEESGHFAQLLAQSSRSMRIIDPRWGQEQIIARLAGFEKPDVEML